MKKLLFKVSLVAGLMLLVPYYLLGGGTMPGFLQDMFKSGKEVVAPMTNMTSVSTDKEVTLYKCTNDQGHIEFSQSPCLGEGVTIHLKPNVNVVQRTKIPEEEEAESEGGNVITLGNSGDDNKKKEDAKDKKEGELELGNPYDPDNIQKLVKDAQNVGKLMDQRNQQLQNTSAQPR